ARRFCLCVVLVSVLRRPPFPPLFPYTTLFRSCHRYCTAFVIARGKPLTLAVEPVAGEDSKADAVERVLARVETYHFETKQILIRSEEHTSELQSRFDLVCRLLPEKKKRNYQCI